MKLKHALLSRSGLVVGICFALSPAVTAALPLIDDFDDGDDAGWTRYDPLVGFGAGGSWSFPAGGYQIQAPTVSPNPGALGGARAGSLRNDETITDAVVSWDVVAWDNGLAAQVFGGLARVSDINLGTTDAYGLVYGNNSLDILRFDDEAFTTVAAGAITLNPSNDYRFVFTLTGAALQGQVFDLAAPTTPLLTIGGTDSTYASGVTGFLVADGSGIGTANATFDNFSVVVPEPAGSVLALLGLTVLLRRRR